MDNTKVIIFNAPPNAGKDFICEQLQRIYHNSNRVQFKDKLYELMCTIYELDIDDVLSMMDREYKEKPHILLNHLSPRQALIKISEHCIKPEYGNRYFGEALTRKIGNGLYFISDGGFYEELAPIIEKFGKENVLVIRIRGRGSFNGDSRQYLSKELIQCESYDVFNVGTKDEFIVNVCEIVGEWLSRG